MEETKEKSCEKCKYADFEKVKTEESFFHGHCKNG